MSRNVIWLRSMLFFSFLHFTVGCSQIEHSPEINVSEEPRPNILLIYTDQQRADTIASLGNNVILTPTLDSLVSSGTSYTNAFVTAPVCAPSRWTLMSGLYTSQHQTYSNHHWGPRPEYDLPGLMGDAGYRTVLAGKNHTFLGEDDVDALIPTPRYDNLAEDRRSAQKPAPWSPAEDPMAKLTTSAIAEISIAKEEERPFFMWLSYYYPHDPFQAPEPYFSMYDDQLMPDPIGLDIDLAEANKPFRHIFHKTNNDLLLPYTKDQRDRALRTYYGMVSLIDDQVARVLSHLEDKGMLEDTIVIFTSDHGDYMGDYGLFTKSPSMYDALNKVPMIISGGPFERGLETDQLVSHIDLMPTFLSLAGVDVPEALPGRNILTSDKRDFVISEYGIPGAPVTSFEQVQEIYPDFPQSPITYTPDYPWEANPVSLAGRFRMLRTQEWKLVSNPGGISELYDLKNDPNEELNLYADPAFSEIRIELEQTLKDWVDENAIDEGDEAMSLKNLQDLARFRDEDRDPRELYDFNPSTTY